MFDLRWSNEPSSA